MATLLLLTIYVMVGFGVGLSGKEKRDPYWVGWLLFCLVGWPVLAGITLGNIGTGKQFVKISEVRTSS